MLYSFPSQRMCLAMYLLSIERRCRHHREPRTSHRNKYGSDRFFRVALSTGKYQSKGSYSMNGSTGINVTTLFLLSRSTLMSLFHQADRCSNIHSPLHVTTL